MDKYQIDRKLFQTGHYNILAKQFREALTPYFTEPDGRTTALVDLAMSMTRRFAVDNSLFQPEKFLDACSPDAEMYPMSELWDDVQQAKVREVIENNGG